MFFRKFWKNWTNLVIWGPHRNKNLDQPRMGALTSRSWAPMLLEMHKLQKSDTILVTGHMRILSTNINCS